MISPRLFRPILSKAFGASVLGLTMLAFAQGSYAQYSTTFDQTAVGSTVSGTDGWDSNDDFTGSTYTYPNTTNPRDIGQSDGVTSIVSYRANTSDHQAVLGGVFNVDGTPGSNGSVPGHAQNYLFHATNLAAGSNINFSTDYVVTAPSGDAHDTFGFAFRNGLGTSLFSVDFIPSVGNPNSADNVRYTVGNSPVAAVASIALGSRYKLSVSVNAATNSFSVFITPETLKGVISGTTSTIANNVAFTGSIADVAATWLLADLTTADRNGVTDTPGPTNTNNVAYVNAGSNALIFDNVVVAVPEPSTYALLGLGAFGLLALRRRACRA